MTVSYLDTMAEIVAAGEAGLPYGKFTRAMRRHALSMAADGIIAAYLPSGETVSFDTEGCVVCLTADGMSTVDMYAEAGLVQPREALLEHGPTGPKAKPARRRRKATRTAKKVTSRTVPTALGSVSSPVVPKGQKAVKRVPGGSVDTLVTVPVTTDDRVAALEAAMERKFSALLASIEAMSS